jgi:hypothetical protein
MPERTIRDRLREEYFDLLPEIRRVAWHLETEVRHLLLPIQNVLAIYEHLTVKSRIKECESALNSLERKQEGNVFDPDKANEYSILKLQDLAGVRVLAFPQSRVVEADRLLKECESFNAWIPRPLTYGAERGKIPKYFGYFNEVSKRVYAEYQIVPMLIGLFWEVEHAAMYKPTGSAKGIDRDERMKQLRTVVETSLSQFDAEFQTFVKADPSRFENQ